MAAFGRGVPQDPAQAAYWLRLAADDEKPLACGVLGHCYLRGLGVQQDDGEAFALLDRFAEAYDREKPDDGETSTYPDELVGIAYNGLGELYADGRGGPVDIKEGITMLSGRRRTGQRRRPTQSRPIQKELVRQMGEEIAASEDLRLPPAEIMRMSGGPVSSAPRCPRRFSLFPFAFRATVPARLLSHPLYMPPSCPEAVPPVQPSFSEIPLHINRILAHVAPERGPAQKALSRSSQGCRPTLPSPTEIRPSCGNKPLLRKQLNGHRRRGELRGLHASRRRASLRTQNASHRPNG